MNTTETCPQICRIPLCRSPYEVKNGLPQTWFTVHAPRIGGNGQLQCVADVSFKTMEEAQAFAAKHGWVIEV